jgi:uracil-DNA glycosylase family 4
MQKTNQISTLPNVLLPPPLQTSPDLWYGTSGPRDARIVIVGEAWGRDEDAAKAPFVGASGMELTTMLQDAGIDRRDCLLTNVVAARPPNNELWRWFDGQTEVRGLCPNSFVVSELQRLYNQIVAHPRALVIATGNYALWAMSDLCGNFPVPQSDGVRAPNGIMSWRGSMIYTKEFVHGTLFDPVPLLPIIHPAAILRDWSQRYITVHDLRARVPMALAGNWQASAPPILLAPPTFNECVARLDHWLRVLDKGSLRLASDIETYRGLITCIGFADSANFAMTIPFVRRVDQPTHLLDSWWTPKQEALILLRLRKLFRHPNLDLEGQNFIYDAQYIAHHWGVMPDANFDTMYAWHVCFPGTPKALDYLSSLFCRYHRYWKDDHKEWDLSDGDPGTLFRYNAEDCVRTYECATHIRKLVAQYGLVDQWEWMRRKRDLALSMMTRGVAIDQKLRDRIGYELMEKYNELASELLRIIPQAWAGEPGKSAKTKEPVLWFSSHKQLKWIFGEFLGIPIPVHRKNRTESLGKEALNELREKYPVWRPLFDLLSDLRSVGVFITHFVRAPLDPDRRMRCSFNPAGTETFRWSSSKNAFGRGANLQNLPKGDED